MTLAALAAGAGAGPALGQGAATYGAGLACAGFREQVHTEVRTQLGGGTRRETVRREGVLQVRGAPSQGGLAVEAWYESLSLARETPEGTLVPDTDGLLGGRYRGVLTDRGGYRSAAEPFVPDDVAEVTDLRRALADFFPPLPGVALAVGGRASDEDGTTFERLRDSVVAGEAWTALRVTRRREGTTPLAEGAQDALRVEREESTLWWTRTGPRGWRRWITVETTVTPGAVVRQAVRVLVEQRITVERMAGCAPEGSAADGA